MKKGKLLARLAAAVLSCCLLLSGCGESAGESKQRDSVPQQGSLASAPLTGSSVPASQPGNEEDTEVDENTIVVGGWTKNTNLEKMAQRFNQEQSRYKVVVRKIDNLVLELMRKKGPDLIDLSHCPVEEFARKGVLEELTPYFNNSSEVQLDDLLEDIKRLGTVDGKLTSLILSFSFQGIAVEKGHTRNGGWTLEDYIALAEQYPEIRICEKMINDPVNLFLNDLAFVAEGYISWEDYTCSFDSDSFINFIEKINAYSRKKYDFVSSGTPAERLRRRDYLTCRFTVIPSSYMQRYLQLREMLGEEYELAGFPSVTGKPQYKLFTEYHLGINAASEKKEAAWAFLEYLLSEGMQDDQLRNQSSFPARKDVLEAYFQELIGRKNDEAVDPTFNMFTEEYYMERIPFTEEDRAALMAMLEHMELAQTMFAETTQTIIAEELSAYFKGDKSAKDAAGIIQSKIRIYLMEQQ